MVGSSPRRRAVLAVVGLVVASVGVAVSSVAAADGVVATETGDALEVAGSLVADAAPVVDVGDSFVAKVAGSEVELPADPAEPLVLDGPGGEISVELPVVPGGGDGVVDDSGAVVYESDVSPVSFAAQATADGGMQVLVVIEGADAPMEYVFPLELPDGARLAPSDGGSVDIVDENGFKIASVAPPWAVDANGKSIPSRFVINGFTLTQVVEHGNATYPVVADPRLSFGTYNAIYTGLSNLCRHSKWTCKTVDVTVETVQSGWRNSSCGSVGIDVKGFGAGIQSCTWERVVTLRVRLYGYRSGSKNWVMLNNNIWGPSYLIEKTHGGCAVVCWGAPEPRESLGAKGWTFSENWWG